MLNSIKKLWNSLILITFAFSFFVMLMIAYGFAFAGDQNSRDVLITLVLPLAFVLAASLLNRFFFDRRAFYYVLLTGILCLTCLSFYGIAQSDSPALLWLVACVYVFIALPIARRLTRIERDGVETTATITDHGTAYPGLFRLSFKHRYLFEYTDTQGILHRGDFTRFLFFTSLLHPGDQITLRYLPSAPETYYVIKFLPVPYPVPDDAFASNKIQRSSRTREKFVFRLKKFWNLGTLSIPLAYLLFIAMGITQQTKNYIVYLDGANTVATIEKIYSTTPFSDNPEHRFHFMNYSYRVAGVTYKIKAHEIGDNEPTRHSTLLPVWKDKKEGDHFDIRYRKSNPRDHLLVYEKSLESHLMFAFFVSFLLGLPMAVTTLALAMPNRMILLRTIIAMTATYPMFALYRLLAVELSGEQQRTYAISALLIGSIVAVLVRWERKMHKRNRTAVAEVIECNIELRPSYRWAAYIIRYTLAFKDALEATHRSDFVVFLLDPPRFHVGEQVRIRYNSEKPATILSVTSYDQHAR